MKLRVLMAGVVLAVLCLVTGTSYAANGDLIVNGNLGVGTTTAPKEKAEINGNMIVNGNVGIGTTAPTKKLHVEGDAQISGQLCVGSDCTNTLHVSGGLYGHCTTSGTAYTAPVGCANPISPSFCTTVYGYVSCACPTGYSMVTLGWSDGSFVKAHYSCLKN